MSKLFYLASFILLSGCSTQYKTYTAKPLESDTEKSIAVYQAQNIDSTALRDWLTTQGVQNTPWPRTSWDIDSLVFVGEFFSSALAVEKAKVAVAKAAEITASQKRNPEITLNSEYHSDRSGGVSPWTLGGLFSWVYEKPEKRQTRIDYAQAVTDLAKLKAADVKWQIRDGIVDHYLDVLVASQKQIMLLEEVTVLQSMLDVLTRSMELGQISDFELSATRLALQQSELAVKALDVAKTEARTQLALAAGLPADALLKVMLDEGYFSQLPTLDMPALKLDVLQSRALVTRPDIRYALAEYLVAEADLHREIMKQYPDFTLSPGFIFDQSDNVWALASDFILPIHDLHVGPIVEAEAQRALKAEQVLALQRDVLQQVHQSRIMYQTSKETLKDADNVITELNTQQAKLQRQYDLGFSDRLALIRNQREFLAIQRSRYLLQETGWRAFWRMEDAMMSQLIGSQ